MYDIIVSFLSFFYPKIKRKDTQFFSIFYFTFSLNKIWIQYKYFVSLHFNL